MPTLVELKQQLSELVQFTAESVKGGLTWDELLILEKKFTAAAMAIVAVGNLGGDEKKALVLEAAGWLFDAFAGRLSLLVLPWYWSWLLWLVGPVARPIFRQIFIAAVSKGVEQIFDRLYRE